jgi:HK97 family phage major capsid protein
MSIATPLKARRAALKADLETLINLAESESRGLDTVEDATFISKTTEMRQLDERITELQEAETREAAAAAHRVDTAPPVTRFGEGVRNESNPVYRRDSRDASYFKDMFLAKVESDPEARGRLAASQETRAGDMTTVAGAGGTFAPPLWLVQDYVAYARPHRVTADIVNKNVLPKGISSVNLPKVLAGATTGVQVTQNSALTDTAMTTTSVSSGITLIAGKQIISRQLLDQSGIPFDKVILQDLAADYASQLDKQVILGSGSSGQLRGLAGAGTTVTYTSAAPVVVSTTSAASFYNAVIRGVNQVASNRFLPANAIVMRPDRWAWVLEALDSSLRPLVVPNGPSFNQLGTGGMQLAEGAVGSLVGLPVYIDPNIPVTMNSATNQDAVFVLRTDDVFLYESELEAASFDATYADNASILFRILGYAALIPDRYATSVSVILGTGLVQATL